MGEEKKARRFGDKYEYPYKTSRSSLRLTEGPKPTVSSYWLSHLSNDQQYTQRQSRIRLPGGGPPLNLMVGSLWCESNHTLHLNFISVTKGCLQRDSKQQYCGPKKKKNVWEEISFRGVLSYVSPFKMFEHWI